MSAPNDLLMAQRDFARFVTAADAADELEALRVAGTQRSVVARVRSDREIPALMRLRVYSNAYFERILGVLREDYGALHGALGEDAFHDLVKLYLMAFPSRSFSLRFAGEQLPEFLRAPAAELFARRWPYAADLAALEWAMADLFDAPDAPVLERADLGAIAPESWPELRLALIPAERRLELGWPVQRLREAWSAGLPFPEIHPSATAIVVWRRGERVHQRALLPLEATALELVRGEADFATICASAVDATSEVEGMQLVLAMLERWVADGLLQAAVRD